MGTGAEFIRDGCKLKYQNIRIFDRDILVEGYINVPWEE
jgi:hypothetical protein